MGSAGTILHYQHREWSLYPSPVENHLLDIHFDSENRGWIVGVSGVILEYHQEGKWIEMPSPSKKALYTVTTDNTGNLWVSGKGGKIFRYGFKTPDQKP